MPITTKIYPFLWFDSQAEEAMNFYVSLFPDSKVGTISRYGAGGPLPAGTAMVAQFWIGDQKVAILNGGPIFKQSEAFSFVITCDTQEEIDHYWEALTAGGSEGRCGWLKDKFGLSWQVVPTQLGQLLSEGTPAQCQAAFKAMMGMNKLSIPEFEKAKAEASGI
jgi:predicted 3-demethylubiquinone-9 3-methyltransferase (glyoxalase superfamily)